MGIEFGSPLGFPYFLFFLEIFTLYGRFIAHLSKLQKLIFQHLGKEIQKFLWWPEFYLHKLQNDISYNHIGLTM